MKYFLAIVIVFAVIFLVAAFIAWEINPYKWGYEGRFACIAGSAFAGVLTTKIIYDIKD